MAGKVRNIISVLLVTVLLSPMLIKLFDGLLHHHDHFVCSAKTEKHFHKHHEECRIASFELSFFSADKQPLLTEGHSPSVEINDLYRFLYIPKNPGDLFSLRAPPVFTN